MPTAGHAKRSSARLNAELAEVAKAAAEADRRMSVLRTELGLHVSEMSMLDRPLAVRA